jgi:hypothetical protein
MANGTGRIIKGKNVEFKGQVRVGVLETAPSQPKEKSAAGEPTVRIVESHPEFAIIELTCSCGTRTHLRCEYPAAEASGTSGGGPPNT